MSYFWSTYCRFLKKLLFSFLIEIHSMQGWTATTSYGVTGKEAQKWLQGTKNLFRKNLYSSITVKSITRKTNEEAVRLAILFFYVFPRHTNIMAGSMCLMNVLPDVYICPLRKNNSFWGDSKIYTSGSMENPQRMPTGIN